MRAMTKPEVGRRKKWLLRLMLIGSIAVAAALLPRLLRRKPLPVEAIRVERTTVRDEVSSASAGEVVAEHHATVRTELPGRVVLVRHRRGDRVRRGDLVLAIDSADLDAKHLQALAALEAQRAQAEQAQARAEATTRSAERARTLAAKGAGTEQLADDTAAARREAEAQARAARGLIAQSEAALRSANVARNKALLTAPFDGLIVELSADPGDELQPGVPVFEIIDDSKLRVEATIDEADIGRVRIGQPSTLRLDALPGRSVAGTVTSVGPWVRRDEKGARTMRIEVGVNDLKAATDSGLRAGMSANVDVRVAEKKDVPSLPTNVIVGRGTQRNVYLIEQDKAVLRAVQIGLSSWERTEIVSGVVVGDRVVATLNVKDLADGVRVTLTATH